MKFAPFIVSFFALCLMLVGCAKAEVDVGKVDKAEPQKAVAPKAGDTIQKVGIRANITGEIAKSEKRNVYILICPISNKDTSDWWVQESVGISGDKFGGSCQFGEGSAGVGENFAIMAMATEKKYSVGERVSEIPAGQSYSKTVIVKRED